MYALCTFYIVVRVRELREIAYSVVFEYLRGVEKNEKQKAKKRAR